MKATKLAVRHPVYITMIIFALIIFGVFSLSNMNAEFMSDISMPQAMVVTIYPGASASQVRDEVVEVLEENFATLPNYSSMTTTAKNSFSITEITYADGVDVYDQVDELRYRISTLVEYLPDGVSGIPQVVVGGASMLPIFTFAVEGGEDLAGLNEYVNDTLYPQLTRIKNVSSVTVDGGLSSEILINLDIEKLSSKKISPLAVYQVLENSNTSLPLSSGVLKSKTTNLKFEGNFESLEDIENLTVGASEDNTLIKLKDVATVELSQEIGKNVKTDGKNIIYITVSKRTEGNVFTIINKVKDILAEEEANTHSSVKFNIISDDTKQVGSSLISVTSAGLMGVLIAIIVIFFSLGDIKATIIIGLSIPFSIFFTLICMKVMGISLNLLSLSGIVVALGTIVDGSIVMIEQVYVKYKMKNADGKYVYTVRKAIYTSSDEVGKSVLGSALTTIAVFFPLLFIPGIVGSVLKDISVSFIAAIVGSAVAAIIFIPYLLILLLPENRKKERRNIIEIMFNSLNKFYGKLVRWSLEHKFFLILICIVLLFFTGFVLMHMRFAFIESIDSNEFYVNVEYPSSYSADEIEERMDYIEALVRQEVPEIKYTICSIASAGLNSFPPTDASEMRIILTGKAERDRSVQEIIPKVKYLLDSKIPDATVVVKNGGFDTLLGYATGGGGYAINLIGDDFDVLYEDAQRIQKHLSKHPEVMSSDISASFDSFEAVLKASSKDLNSLGLTTTESAVTSTILFSGLDVGNASINNKSYDIELSSNINDQSINANMLNDIPIVTQSGQVLNLSSLVDMEINQDISELQHQDRSLALKISAVLTSASTTDVSMSVSSYLEEYPLSPGVSQTDGGLNELFMSSIKPIATAAAISLFLVFMIIVFQFESFSQPFLILLTFPFSIIGVALVLIGFNTSLNLISTIGLIALMGISVNNGIILTDYMNMLVKRKRVNALAQMGEVVNKDSKLRKRFDYKTELSFLKESIVEASSSRLRSILMTTLTTMLGVVPMALGRGEGGEMYASLGQSIAGGLLATTLVALFLMPVLYFILENKKLKKDYRGMNK